MSRWNSCNILRTAADGRTLWQFEARKSGFQLGREHTVRDGESPPATVVNKSWNSLWQPKLNVAWLPPKSVFLRVVQLPKSTPEELLSMVELQLEKLSPIPVTQAVWSIQPLAQTADGLQTVIVILAERKAVEEFLGRLEGQGFLADRLELPVLDQLLATPVGEDGAWIYPGVWDGSDTALVAWWYSGVLQNINFVSLSAVSETGDRAAALSEQLNQTAWAGELDGWLTSPPAWHLVADETTAAEWEPLLRHALDQTVIISPPLSTTELAALTANRATKPESRTNLLPAEFSKRYQQQFVDRLWIHGLGAAALVYVACVLVYFAIVGVVSYQAKGAEKQVAAMSNTYTNAIQLRDRFGVLKERQELKFAALDCWKAVSELLPETLTLDNLTFTDGRVLRLNGTAPKDEGTTTLDFHEAMRKATANGQPLFVTAGGGDYSFRHIPGQPNGTWGFNLELKRVLEK